MKLIKSFIIGLICLATGLFAFIILHQQDQNSNHAELSFRVKSLTPDQFQVFYSHGTEDWSEEKSVSIQYNKTGEWEKLAFELPRETERVRIDVGTKKGSIMLSDLLVSGNVKEIIPLIQPTLNQLQYSTVDQTTYEFLSEGGDPFFSLEITPYMKEAFGKISKIEIAKELFISLITCIVVAFILKFCKTTIYLMKSLLSGQKLIISLAKNDFKTKYASSYLGITWGFVQPILTIITYWFVFQVGLRSGSVSEVPFILWFLAGIVPWFFFSEAFSGATNSLSEYSYLVKKVVFPIELLPAVKVISVLFVQLFFLGFILFVYALYGYYPSVYNFQALYYLFCMVILVLALSYFTSAVVLFFKDLNQIIIIVLQIGFWFTPIGWPLSILSEKWRIVFQLNPMYYIVQGYRDSFIDRTLFYQRPIETLYFWLACITIMTVGVIMFKKLRPHFADVL